MWAIVCCERCTGGKVCMLMLAQGNGKTSIRDLMECGVWDKHEGQIYAYLMFASTLSCSRVELVRQTNAPMAQSW